MSSSSDAAAVVARGNSLVFTAPPCPSYSVPILAAALERLQQTPVGAEGPPRQPILLVVPAAAITAWADAAGAAGRQASRPTAAGLTPERFRHHLLAGVADLLITTLAIAAESVGRGVLKMETLGTMVLAWPELNADDTQLTTLLADFPKETPRIILTSDPVATAELIERHAWRAPTMGLLGNLSSSPTINRIRTATASWDGRIRALGAIADLLGKDHLTVWTADDSDHGRIVDQLGGYGVTASPVTEVPPAEGLLVFYDAPSPGILEPLDSARFILLAAPGTERYFASLAHRIEPIALPHAGDSVRDAMAADRRTIRAKLAAGADRGAYATVAPLFDSYPPSEVAIALQSLWIEARNAPPPPQPEAQRAAPAVRRPKVWVSTGRKDGTTIGELLALLTMDASIPSNRIGKIESRDTFSLIEFATDQAAQDAVEKLAGQSFKGRRLAARLDRGPDRPGTRPRTGERKRS